MAEAFYGPRSRENARLLLNAAKAVGVPARQIRTQVGGYLVPEAVVDHINEAADGAEKAAEEPEVQEATGGAAGATEEQGEAPKRPSVTESKADWLTYATHLGLDVTDENTKAEIVEAVKATEEEAD